MWVILNNKKIFGIICIWIFFPLFLQGSIYAIFENFTNPLFIPRMSGAKKVVLTRGKYQGKPTVLGVYQINSSVGKFMRQYEKKIKSRGMEIITSSFNPDFSVLVAKDDESVLGAIITTASGKPMLTAERIKGSPEDLMNFRGRNIEGIPPPPGGRSVFYNEQSNGRWMIKEAIYTAGSSPSGVIDYYREEMQIRGWGIKDMPYQGWYENGIFFSKNGLECMIGANEENGRTSVIIILKE